MAWADEIERCRADPACRAAPQTHFDQFCEGAWPSGDTFDRLGSVLDGLTATASACRDAVCPDIDCNARSQTVLLLGDLRQAITAVADSHDQPGEDIDRFLQQAESLIVRLGEIESGSRSVETWSADVEALDNSFSEIAPVADVAVRWRARLIVEHLSAVSGVLPASDAAPDWVSIAPLVATAAVEIANARAAKEAALAAPCGGINLTRADDLRERARDVEALLAVCAARAACATDDIASGIERFGVRGSSDVDDLRAFADAVATALESNVQLGLAPQPAPTLTLEHGIFSSSEAIRVELDISETACMAEPGALLAIMDPGHPDAPLFTSSVADRPQQDVFLEAPRRPGNFEVAAQAPLARGGGVLFSAPIEVSDDRPTTCDGFNGVWGTGFGELVMYQRGEAARGTYRRFEDVRPGFLVGEVRDGVLRGDWESELGSGSVRLQLSRDGTSFSGSWTHSRGASAGSGRWAGRCIASE